MRFGMREVAIGVMAVAAGCSPAPDTGMSTQDFGPDADEDGHSAATQHTAQVNEAFAQSLPIANTQDFEEARRGFIATDENLVVRNPAGDVIWDLKSTTELVEGDCPPSVNPSLWRQAQLNAIHGLFKVTDRIYQVRGYDLSNMSIIEGDTGRIIIDPLTCIETASAALTLVNRELGEREIKAVVFTHSHIDHFGGVKGIVSEDDVKNKGVRIIAPKDFMHEAVIENVLVGIVMGRRAQYMFGMPIARTVRGHVDSGLGKQTPFGSFTIIEPTDSIGKTGATMTIDGVEFEFQYTPESEAPAEMAFFLPQFNAYCGAEIVSRTMHNLYTLRGTKVRDALKWSGYIHEAIERYGDEMDVVFNSHHWPVWGGDRARDYLAKQRDTYKFIHDQTLGLASLGMTPNEIAETIELPPSLRDTFANRGYYGTIEHNSKAVYQFYFGWYDSNPANLNPLPPEDEAQRYVEAMGGVDRVVELAQTAYGDGDYRWAARLLNHVVFAAPNEDAPRALLSKSYDQLGYQSEAGPWRDEYLTAARELRHGIVESNIENNSSDILQVIPLDFYFKAMATRLNAERAADTNLTLNFNFTDTGQTFVIWIENAVMHHREGEPGPDADATVTLTRAFWLRLIGNDAGLRDMIFSDEFNVQGERLTVLSFFRLMDRPESTFPIVTP